MSKTLSGIFLFSLSLLLIISCSENKTSQIGRKCYSRQGSFAYDKDFLAKHDSDIVELKNDKCVYSYLTRIPGESIYFRLQMEMKEKVSGGSTIRHLAQRRPHMNAYGGENRFWLGPEGGKYSLYFKKGDSMVFDNWKTPAPIDTENWQVTKKMTGRLQ